MKVPVDYFMTSTVLAEYRAQSVRSARRFMHSGAVPLYLDGGRPRVKKSDVDAYMEAHRVEPRETPAAPSNLREALARIAGDTLKARRKTKR